MLLLFLCWYISIISSVSGQVHRDLFGFIQPVCSSHVRFHLWDPGSYDTGKTKIDPAIATGPFISITNDIIGMMLYMGITVLLS